MCYKIDADNDGKFGNYPSSHIDFDINDNNPCIPISINSNCDCPDLDGDGYIEVCHLTADGNKQQLKVFLSSWILRQSIGDTCGSCR